jgi:hypothetical protein
MSKYISFSTHQAGLINILMSLEVALALSEITGRTLIIPPNFWCFDVSEGFGKEHFVDILKFLNKESIYSNFNCIDFYDVPEFSELFSKIEKKETSECIYSYTGNIENCINDLKKITFAENCRLADTQIVLFCGQIESDLDFSKFCGKRTEIINLNFDEKFLHFEANLFAQYWYSIYPGNSFKRNQLKQKINSCLLYDSKFLDISKKVYDILGPYDSVHIRRTDFLDLKSEDISSVSTPEKLLFSIKYLFKENKPLYISTDEKDLKFFDKLGTHKNIYFFSDFYDCYQGLDKSIIEQLICVNSELFYGTYQSTYSKRINILRGYQNKQTSDAMGINNLYEPICDYSHPLPWIKHKKYWYWSSSSHPQWTFE